MAIELYEDFAALIDAFNRNSVSYIVVGGYAVIHYGYERTTGDLDIWVQQTHDNFVLMQKAFTDFGLPGSAIEESDFLKNEKDVYTFGRPPVCIDILTAVKGIKFEEAFQHIQTVVANGIEVKMIDVRDLIKAKTAAGRHKDLDDIDKLSKYKPPK